MEENQLTQPILNSINAFDASMDYTFTFVSIGGNQVVANILTIIDNSNGEEVYKETQSTMRLEHILPANTLENGNYYSASIQTVDNAEQVSQSSIAVPFYCYSTPSLTINNMPINGTINNNSYTFRGSYSQLEGELLNSYQFILYNNNKEVISKTNIIYYDTDNSLSYNITGMSSNTSYFIELTGVTVNGTKITSGLLPFNVNYSQAASFAICDLVNDCDNGYIQISSNIVSISGNSNPNPPTYIDDKEVDLTEDGSWVNWDNGFNIQDDFTLRAWGRNFNDFENIIELKNPNDTNNEPNKIDMKWMIGNIKKELPKYIMAQGSSVYLDDSKAERIKNFIIEGNSIKPENEENGIYSLGDKKNLINIENFNIEYSQQYSQDTNTGFLLNGSYEYTVSFDYVINSATTDLYYSIGYGKDSYETSIVENIQYNTQDNGRNYFTFKVPESIPEGMYLWIKFANTIILSDINVDISNIQLESGKNVTDYQSPLKYNIYPTVTRKNIFDYKNPLYLELNNINLDLIQNGYNISPIEANKDAYISIGYKNLMQEGNDYTLSYSTLGNFKNMELFTVEKGTKNVVNPITLDNGSFVAPNCCYDIQIRFYVDSSSLQNSLQIWNIQIESGTVITDYETYESQIWDIELDNQLHGIENYKDIICIQNINYLNPENQQAEISENTIYYFSQLNNTTYYLWFYNEDNNLITFIYNGETVDNISGEKFNFTSPEGTKYLKITKSNNAEANDVPKDEILSNMISVEEGENSIVYYPYINTPSIIKYFEEKTFNGSEGWFIGSAPTQESTLYLLLENTQTGLKSNIVNCMSYSLKSYSADYLWDNDVEGIAQSQTQIIIRINKTTAGDLDAFKQYLSSNNIYGIFRLQIPITSELSSENINRLSRLSTYYPISNVFFNNNIQGSTRFKYVNNYDIQETKNSYILLKCYNNNMLPYIITSNYIDIPLETDKIFIWVRRVNNIFDLKIENLGDYSEGGGGEDKTNPIVTFDGEPIVTNNSISVTANCIDDNGLRTVRFSKNNGSTWDEEIAVDEISVTQEYTFTELDADTEYTIRVEAIDLSGNIGGISEKITTSS